MNADRLQQIHKDLGIDDDPIQQPSVVYADVAVELLNEVYRLRAAVDEHRRQRGDDRCWQDDDTLYAAVFPEYAPAETALPPQLEFLESCSRSCHQFWMNRQRPGEHGTFPHPKTIKQLEDENAELREEINQLNSVIRGL